MPIDPYDIKQQAMKHKALKLLDAAGWDQDNIEKLSAIEQQIFSTLSQKMFVALAYDKIEMAEKLANSLAKVSHGELDYSGIVNVEWVQEFLPAPPKPWEKRQDMQDGAMWVNPLSRQSVIFSGETWGEKRWIHVSTAFPERLPGWDELKAVKDLFIGDELQALVIFPPAKFYVNINPNVLHLWCCVDGDGLPDFTRGIGSI